MKVVGIITEYNPFHKGHEFHIRESLRVTGADRAIVVMSGDFVQRGTPAIMPKHLRTEMALKGGASMVIELPITYATASAEDFAHGAVELLDSLACVDSICFGSESGDIHLLSQIADVLIDEPMEYQHFLQESLRSGLSYPKARETALMAYSEDHDVDASILNNPNNILGVEYLKALKSLNSTMTPYTITRNTSQYHDTQLGEIHSSATAIREVLYKHIVTKGTDQKHMTSDTASLNLYNEKNTDLSEDIWNSLNAHVTSDTLDIMKSNYQIRFPIVANDFSLLLFNKLLTTSVHDLFSYTDVTEELARRIYNLRHEYQSFNQFTELVKTKNYTYSRVSRCLLHILLDIKDTTTGSCDTPLDTTGSKNMVHFNSSRKQLSYNHYIHVLGFKKEDQDLLTYITKESKLPLLTKLKDLDTLSPKGQKMIAQDMAASNLYEMVAAHKFDTPFIPELSKSMILNKDIKNQ